MWKCKKCGGEVGKRFNVIAKIDIHKEPIGRNDNLSEYDFLDYKCSCCGCISDDNIEEIADWEED